LPLLELFFRPDPMSAPKSINGILDLVGIDLIALVHSVMNLHSNNHSLFPTILQLFWPRLRDLTK
jgi:hypothetical protein